MDVVDVSGSRKAWVSFLQPNYRERSMASYSSTAYEQVSRTEEAPPIILYEMVVISLEAPEESPDSIVRFCLGA